MSFVPANPDDHSAGDYTYQLNKVGSVSFNMLPNCLTSLNDCTDMNTAAPSDLDAGVSGLTCSGSVYERGYCQMHFDSQGSQMGGYSTAGGNLTTSGAEMGTPDTYCVDGDRLRMKVNSINGVVEYITAQRHGK